MTPLFVAIIVLPILFALGMIAIGRARNERRAIIAKRINSVRTHLHRLPIQQSNSIYPVMAQAQHHLLADDLDRAELSIANAEVLTDQTVH